jgi:DNA modification methylase
MSAGLSIPRPTEHFADAPPPSKNTIYCGDCDRVLWNFPEGSADLIYADPPFFTNRQYEVIWGDGYEIRSFEDRWKGGIENYITWIEPKLRECHRVLSQRGSMYLHCDSHANAHLRILMDRIFGAGGFRCEVIWDKGCRGTERKRNWQQAHDTLFFYTKTTDYTWNDQFQEYADPDLSRYNKKDADGRQFALIKRRRTDGMVYYGKTYPGANGKRINDIISVPVLAATAKERVGYPTQKPEELLSKMIVASSNPGDTVLDPFCGCGTAVVSAHKLKRKWIGIDVSPTACKLMVKRLASIGTASSPTTTISEADIIGLPKSIEELRALEPFEFQNWVCHRLGAKVSQRKSGDMGIDGWLLGSSAVQVKQSEHVGRNVVDNFETALKRARTKKGIIVAFSFGRGSHEEVARTKNEDGLDIDLITVTQLIERA